MYLLAFLPQLPLILFFFFLAWSNYFAFVALFCSVSIVFILLVFCFSDLTVFYFSFFMQFLCSFYSLCVHVFFFGVLFVNFTLYLWGLLFAFAFCLIWSAIRSFCFLIFFFYFCFGFSPAVDFAPLFWVESLIFLYFWPICGAQCKQTQSIVQHIDTNVSATRRSYLFFSFLLLLSPFFCVLGVEVTNDWQLFNMALIEFLIVWLFTCWLPFLHEISLHLREALQTGHEIFKRSLPSSVEYKSVKTMVRFNYRWSTVP